MSRRSIHSRRVRAAADSVAAETVDQATGEVTTAKPKKKATKKVAPKQRTASLFKSMNLADIDLETALGLLNLPRVVGKDPESGDEITAQNGRYGPYLKKGADTRTLPDEDQIFTIDLAGALRALRAAQVRRAPCLKRVERVRRRPGKRQADPRQGRPVRAIRHRRCHQRHHPARGECRGGRLRARGAAARRQTGQGTRAGQAKAGGQETCREEDDREEDDREENDREEDDRQEAGRKEAGRPRTAKKPAAEKETA